MAGRCVVLELCPYSGVSRGLITVASQSVSRVVESDCAALSSLSHIQTTVATLSCHGHSETLASQHNVSPANNIK